MKKGETITWQDWTTLAGFAMYEIGVEVSGPIYDMVLPASEYLDLGEDPFDLTMTLEALELTQAAIVLETASDEGGPWRPLQGISSPGQVSLQLSPLTNQEQTGPDRYIRTRIRQASHTYQPWMTSYRVTIESNSDCNGWNVGGPSSGLTPRSDPDTWIDWTSIRGSSTNAPETIILADADEYWKTCGIERAVVQLEATMLSGATLYLEGAFSKEGPWNRLITYGITTSYLRQEDRLGVDYADSRTQLYPWMRFTMGLSEDGMACWRAQRAAWPESACAKLTKTNKK